MLKEFKDFAIKGNVIDLAVAVVIGAAFGAIITALVNNIIMPIVGALMGGLDFSSLSIVVGSAVIAYGAFIQAIINFIIIAFTIFLIVKAINSSKRKEAEAPAPDPVPTQEEILLSEIRDLLKESK